ncbi:brachyurin-like [Drosophila ficusphila]|uniref:brachyurin-like n=1 Tax=Drosophila ficusphila TaxID=30025 RepID=UPI0007E62301|nr:brachyurin-like [Drosophila ficusphila]
MKVFVVLVLALATASAAVLPKVTPVHPKDRKASASSIQGRVTNGREAVEGEVPYQVGLSFATESGSGWWCGGSLISSEWILTAAHCTSGASSVSAILGATARIAPLVTVVAKSSEFSTHASYNSILLRNDIALIKIQAVTFSSRINAIALASSDAGTLEGETGKISGWGLTSDQATTVADKLMTADVTIIANSVCASTYGTMVVTDRNVCIDTSNAVSTCSGDSGGPLVVKNVLAGVTSFGASAGCELGYPAGFTRVTYYLDWINAITNL